MIPLLHHRRLWSPLRLGGDDLRALLDTARRIRSGATPLRGRHVAVLCHGAGPTVQALRHGIAAGGGTVAMLAANAWRAKSAAAMQEAARVMGRLYDAVDCPDLPLSLVEQIDRDAGVPVFDGLTGAFHPVRLLADLLALETLTDAPLDALRVRITVASTAPQRLEVLQLLATLGLRQPEAALAGPDGHWPEEPEFQLELGVPLGPHRLTAPGASASDRLRLDALLRTSEVCVLQACIHATLG